MDRFFSSNPIRPQSGLLVIRIITGLLMTYHGWEVFDAQTMKGYFDWDAFKGFSSPSLIVYIGKSAELVAGLLLTVGLLTRLASMILIASMLYILFYIGHGKVWYEDQHPFLFVLIGFLFLVMGGGRFSLDYFFFDKIKTKSNA